MSRTETKGLSERERQRQNRIPVIAHCQLELNNNYLYSVGHKEKVDLFVCLFSSKMRTNRCFFNPFAQLVFVVPRQ